METSRKYYEDKLRDFKKYGQGRSLQQFCKEEGIDYKWMVMAKKEYAKRDNETTDNTDDECPSLIQLHYHDDGAIVTKPSAGWTVGKVILTDPDGNEITISCGSAAALGSLLTKLASCHD